jgi:DnaA family protein
MIGRQLALGVQLADAATFDTYFPGANADAIAALRGYAATAPGSGLLLYGAPAAGKTHLLHAVVRAAGDQGLGVAYLPLRELASGSPQILADVDTRALVGIDDVDAVLEDSAWTLALLRLIDALRSGHRHFVLSARAAPDRLDDAPPDLVTRLAACTLLALKPLQDQQRAELLRTRARVRGLEIADDATRWLLTHLPRDPATLVAALDLLDRASLAEQRKLTLPFVQQVVQPLLQHELPLTAPARTGRD